jgi:hypothetical protein
MKVDPRAGKPPAASMLVNVPRLMTAYYTQRPNPSVPGQLVAFGIGTVERRAPGDSCLRSAHRMILRHGLTPRPVRSHHFLVRG